MTEPPAKRARRMDSSTMWDVSDKRPRAPHSPGPESDRDGRSRQGSSKPDGPRKNGRDDRRYRSRSRDRNERRRDRTRSRDRYDRDRDRDGGRRDRDTRGGRDRDRSTSRDRLQSRRGYPSKSDRHDRSRSPARNGTRARSRTPPRGSKGDRRGDRGDTRSTGDDRQANGTSKYKKARVKDGDDENDIDKMDEDEDPDDIDALMRKAVGFSRFRSTKNTKVPGNNIYGVRKEKKTEYRQYMNRTGGFNRPLSPSR